MKKFIQENSLFLVVALTITILSLLKVAKAHAQGNVQALPSKTLDQIYKKDPATPVVTITKQTPSKPTRVVEAKPAPSEPIVPAVPAAPTFRAASSCGIHKKTTPDGIKVYMMDRSVDGYQLVHFELNGVLPSDGILALNNKWKTSHPQWYAELIYNGAAGWTYTNHRTARTNVGHLKNYWINYHPNDIIEQIVIENTVGQFFVFQLNFHSWDDLVGKRDIDPCAIKLTNHNRVKLW